MSTPDEETKMALPLKFDNNRLIPKAIPETLQPPTDVLQGRLCDMAYHISEWSNSIIDSARQNNDWMPVNVTADLLRSRLNMVLKAMEEFHDQLGMEDAPSESDKHIDIPAPMPFLDPNFASHVAYQQYYVGPVSPEAWSPQEMPYVQQPYMNPMMMYPPAYMGYPTMPVPAPPPEPEMDNDFTKTLFEEMDENQ